MPIASTNTETRIARPFRTAAVVLGVLLSLVGMPTDAAAQSCGATGLAVQVLGSGGPDLRDRRASSSYVVWRDGKSIALVDAGGGSAVRFGEAGGRMADLEAILFTHFHADHSADLPALVLSSRFEERDRLLPVFGPAGSAFYPSTTEFIDGLFGRTRGAWRYMFPLVDRGEPYLLQAHDVVAGDVLLNVFDRGDLHIDAVAVDHTPATPALAWRIAAAGKRIVFSGDSGGVRPGLARLAESADVFIAHNATSESSGLELKRILMPPSAIGQIAADAGVKALVLSHRMEETLGPTNEAQTREKIRTRYSGPLEFANDLDCFPAK